MHSDFNAVRDALAGAEVTFATLEVRGDQARVTPAVQPSALYAQLNAHFEQAWSLSWQFDSTTPALVRCRLEFHGHAREGIGHAGEVEQARRLALTDAALAWGLLPAAYTAGEAWVEYDPEEGPNTAELYDGPRSTPLTVPPEPPRDPQLEKAKQHIDDLMDQLREQGRGGPASLILVKHGGYGATVEESRRVYAELKALLKS